MRLISPIRHIRPIKPILFFLSAFLVVGSLIFLFSYFSKPASASWFDEDWIFRKSIAISAHTAAENNVYISITLDTSDTTRFQTDCGDLRFTKQNGELLPYYIVSGCGTNATVVHVQFDTFPAGAQTIYYYYGNPTALDGFNLSDFSTEASNYTVGSQGSEEKSVGPVAYWKFDEGTGQTPQDSTSNNNDGTLGANTGSSTDDPTWTTEDQCVAGKCLKFDGGDYVTASDNSALNPTSAITASAWIKLNSYPTADATILTKGGWSSGTDWAYELYLGSSGTILKFRFLNSSNAVKCDNGGVTINPAISLNTWTHLVATYDGTNCKIYVNNTNKYTENTGAQTLKDEAGAFNIGRRTDAIQYFSGFIDDVKIYNFAKSAAQIKADYNSKSGASSAQGSSAVIGAQNKKYLSDGLVGYWKMDEASGNLTDSSGNGSTGTVTGTSVVAGKFGNGRTFNGSSDKATINSFNTNLITATAWVNPSSLPGSNAKKRVITKYSGSGSTSGHWLLDLVNTSGTQSIRFIFFGSGGTNQANINYTLSTSTWSHLTATFDGTTIRIYVNGAQIGSATTTDTSIPSVSQSLAIAEDATEGSAAEYFAGTLDEVRLYNRALSPKEVSDLYSWAPGPVGYWNFEEGSGGSANDLSGNAYTGTITGATYQSGKFGKGLNFNGGTDAVGSISSISGINTISFWVNPSSTTANLIDVQTTPGTINISASSGTISATGFTSPTIYVNGIVSSTLTANTWQYVTITSATAVTGSALSFGRISATSLTGKLDEVKVYNYARTQKQIISDMNAGHPAVGSPVGSAVAHWKFDEGYGDIANNSGSGGSTLNGNLASSNSCPGNAACPSWSNSGKFGKALSFDGGDYIEPPNSSSLSPGSGDFTMSAWVNPALLNSTARWIYNDYGADADNYIYLILLDTNKFAAYFRDGSGNDMQPISNTALSINTWYHVVGIRQGKNAYIYVNGKLTGTDTDASIGTITVSDGTTPAIGVYSNSKAQNYWSGLIDEVKIYNYALTADEVKLEYNRGSSMILGAAGNNSTYQAQAANQEYCVPGDTTSCAAPIGEWKMEEGKGTSAFDTSGSGYVGTLTGSTIPTWNTGKHGKALKFDGTGNGYVDTGSWSPATGAVTMSAWIYPMTTAQDGLNHVIIAKGNDGTANSFLINNLQGDQVCMEIYTSGLKYQCTPAGSVTPYRWNHVVGTYNGSNSCLIYVNGRLVTGGPSVSCSGTFSGSQSVWIGCESASGCSYPYKGLIDNVRVFNYALTPAQVAWDYNKGAPVGHWKMDECQGNSANDSSGNNNTGTITIGASGEDTLGTCTTSSTAWGSGASGKRNASLSLDGTDDYIDTGNNATLNLTSAITISTWVYWNQSTESYNSILAKESAVDGYTLLLKSNQKLAFYLSTDGQAAKNIDGEGSTVSFNAWHHLVATYDGSNLKTYIDGKLDYSKATTGSWGGNSENLWIGKSRFGSGRYFDGQIDDVKIFNYALTASQVKTLYNGGAVNFGPSAGTP